MRSPRVTALSRPVSLAKSTRLRSPKPMGMWLGRVRNQAPTNFASSLWRTIVASRTFFASARVSGSVTSAIAFSLHQMCV